MSIFQNERIKGAAYAFAGFSAFSIGDSVFKYLGAEYATLTIAFYASFFAFMTMLGVAVARGGIRKHLASKHRKFHFLRGILLLAQFLLILHAFMNLSMAETYALIFIAPFLTTIISIPLLKEKAQPEQWLAILIGLCGVLVILRPGMIPLESGSLAALGAALLFALANITARFIGTRDSVLSFGIYVQFIITPGTFLLMLMTGIEVPTWPHLALLAFAGICGAGGIIFIAAGFAHAPAAIAAPFHYVQMLWAILFGYLIFNDPLDLWVGAGATIIISSGLWLIYVEKARKRKHKQRLSTP